MLQDHIVSFEDGKISVQHEAFTDASIAKKATMLLKFYPGVKGVTLDSTAGLLEVTYNANRLSKDKVMDLLAQGESWLADTKK